MKTHSEDYLFESIDFFSAKIDSNELVFLTDNPMDIKRQYIGRDFTIYIACTRWQLIVKRQLFLSMPEQNIKLVSSRHLDDRFLKGKLVVCLDYLETKPLLALLSVRLRKILQAAPLSLVQTRKTRFWGTTSLKWLARPDKTPLVGFMPGPTGDLISIGGELTNVYKAHYPLLPVLAIITQFNEGDVVEPVVKHLISQGVDVYIIDNWSDDGSYEIIQQLSKKYPKRIRIERYPKKRSTKYEWERLLNRVTEVAKDNKEYKWIISNDADEIRWSPWTEISLQQALSFVDYRGYNCLDFTVFNLYPIKDGFKEGSRLSDFFTHGEFSSMNAHFLQLKAWRNNQEAEIASTGGHLVDFPGRKVFPLKFLLNHYPLRSNDQANRKIFKERMPRFVKSERKKGWHVQYDHIKDNQSFIRSEKGLLRYSDVNFFSKYLLQRVSGIGIQREQSPEQKA